MTYTTAIFLDGYINMKHQTIITREITGWLKARETLVQYTP